MEKEYFLYVRAKVQSRFGDESKLELKVSSMKMLPDVGNQLAKGISVSVDLHHINNQLIDDMAALTKMHAGKLPLRFLVKHEDQKIEMISKTAKVNFTNDLFEDLDRIPHVSYRIES
jgi:DNA polymerase-3 subunit alpha